MNQVPEGLEEKEKLTAIICANILGFNKLTPLMMGKSCSKLVTGVITLAVRFHGLNS